LIMLVCQITSVGMNNSIWCVIKTKRKRVARFFINDFLTFHWAVLHWWAIIRSSHTKPSIYKRLWRRVFSFVRWSTEQKLIVIANFHQWPQVLLNLKIPKDII
jgi:hypothetical protein